MNAVVTTDLSEARKAEVYDAVAHVRDPEIDETVAALQFVVGVQVEGGTVTLSIRLPTFWCPANFVYLMSEDMREAVLALPWVEAFRFRLLDHFAEKEISRGITSRRRFESVFPEETSGGGESGGGLSDLRRDFAGKSLMMRQKPLIMALRAEGYDDDAILALRVDDLDAGAGRIAALWAGCREQRAIAGLSAALSDPALCDAEGHAVEDIAAHLRAIRKISTNAAANGEMCRMLVAARREMSGCSAAHRWGGPQESLLSKPGQNEEKRGESQNG